MKKHFLNFNKEILFGEIGALVLAPLSSYIASLFIDNSKIISFAAVIGALLGASVFWISMRIYHQNKIKKYKIKGLASDIAYFTPAAFLMTLLIYYPTLYFLSNYLLKEGRGIFNSIIPAQIIAFTLFLIGINLYRKILLSHFGRKL
jgi:hypothetical protein